LLYESDQRMKRQEQEAKNQEKQLEFEKQRMKREKDLELERIEKDHVINQTKQDKSAELRAQEE